MQIKEYRIVMPLSVEEYKIGQLYSVGEHSLHESGGGEGIEIVRNEPFTNFPLLGDQYDSGQYSLKKYHMASRIPAFVRLVLPEGATTVCEESWNAYPYCRTVITNPDYMKENFHIIIESLHLPDRGENNAHKLSVEQLEHREVIMIDIANDPVSQQDYKCAEDPTKFKSKSGRGPLVGANWRANCTPVMTCYKLVTTEFKWFGIQNRVENLIQKSERKLFTNFHRKVFCWMDRWEHLTLDDIRALEEEVRQSLDRERHVGQLKGVVAEE